MISAALAKAGELNIKISVAVCDAGGRLIAFNRMDGAIWAGVYGSQGKAVASVAFGRPSGKMQERASSPIVSGISAATDGDAPYPIIRAWHTGRPTRFDGTRRGPRR